MTEVQLYAEACEKQIDDYIEQATRFGAQDTKFTAANVEIQEFTACICHTLDVVASTSDHHGTLVQSEGDFATKDWSWYKELVETQSNDELNRQKTLVDLADSVTAIGYASIAQRTHIRTHPRKLFHHYLCGNCHGAGNVNCHGCSGSGEVSCYGCHGSGRTSCNSCSGAGSIPQTHQVRDAAGHYHMETRYHSCGSCSGGGKVTCSPCWGSGRLKCDTCGGGGKLTCNDCSGHGTKTKITETLTYTTPSYSGIYPESTPTYLHDALNKLGFANLEAHCNIAFNSFEHQSEFPSTNFNYDCNIPTCTLSVIVNSHISHWIMLGVTPTIHTADGAIEVLLKDDQLKLLTLNKEAARWRPWFYKVAEPIIRDVMESEVHQEVIEHSTKNVPLAAMASHLNYAVSDAYITQTLASMQTVNRIIFVWSAIRLAGLMVALLPVIFLVYVIFTTEYDTSIASITTLPISKLTLSLLALVLTLLVYYANRALYKNWLRKVGQTRLVDWVQSHGTVFGKWTTVSAMRWVSGASLILSIFLTSIIFEKFPIWAENGKLFGLVPFYKTSSNITTAPAATIVPLSKPAMKKNNPHKHKKNTSQLNTGNSL